MDRARSRWVVWFLGEREPLGGSRSLAVLTGLSTLLMLLERYDALGLTNDVVEFLLLYLVVPVVAVRWGLGHRLQDYGLQWGRWRVGLFLTGFTVLVAAGVIGLTVAVDPTVRAFYRKQPYTPALWLENFLLLWGWEFLFRGFLLFGYERLFGSGPALWLQMVPFALMHLGKPPLETYSTVLGGWWLGWMAWRTRSVLYPVLAHTFFSTFAVWVAHALP